jgi:hypothetical protein
MQKNPGPLFDQGYFLGLVGIKKADAVANAVGAVQL